MATFKWHNDAWRYFTLQAEEAFEDNQKMWWKATENGTTVDIPLTPSLQRKIEALEPEVGMTIAIKKASPTKKYKFIIIVNRCHYMPKSRTWGI